MSDNNQDKIEEENLDFDDLDDLEADEEFGDLEEFEDFGDDIEEAVDEVLDESIEDDLLFTEGGDEYSDQLKAPKKKGSSLTGKAVIGAALVAAIGGGGFLFTQMGSSPAPAVNPMQGGTPEVSQNEQSGNLPPMPVPVTADAPMADNQVQPEASTDDTVALDIPFGQDAPDEPDVSLSDTGELTPMPSFDSAESSSEELAPLNDLDLATSDVDELAVENIDLAETQAALPVEENDLSDLFDAGETTEEDNIALEDDPSEGESLAVDLSASEEPVVAEVEQPVETVTPKNEDVSSDIEERLSALQLEYNDLKQKNEQKSKEAMAAREQVQTLEGTVSDLQAQVLRLQGQLKAAQASQVPVQAEKKADTSPSPVAVKEPVVSKSAPVVQEVVYEWTLRSAQPGRAMISDKNTGDMRTVEVGDSIKGLGRIRSIQVEDGRWVVRGTSKSIYQ